MFEAKYGDRPLWCAVYELFRDAEPGAVVTYAELDDTLGADVRNSSRYPVYAAQRHLEMQDHRTLECVPNKGYRIVHAIEHERLAVKHQGRARRQVNRARRRASSADRSELNQEQCQRLDTMQNTLARHESLLRRNAARIEEVDEARKDNHRQAKSDVSALAARVDELAARLDREREHHA